MRDLFFFGTLRHSPLCDIVLGAAADLTITDDVLPDHAVCAVAEGPFPTILPQEGAAAQGILVRGLTDALIARLDFYEGSFEYELRPVTLKSGARAEVYFPKPGQWTAQGPWSLDDWVETWGELSCLAATEVMGYWGRKSAAEVATMFPMIRARAWSQINARGSRHGQGTLAGAAEMKERTRSYARFFAMDDVLVQHDLFGGGRSDTLDRAVFVGADAALVLPYDPVRDRVLLVEQFRLGPLARGDRTMWQYEPIAGRIDAGETPQGAARREALEEAGLTLTTLEPVAEAYASPGTSTEFYYIFVGLTDLPDDVAGLGGLETENEDIRSHILSFDDLLGLCDSFGAANTPLIVASFWLARHRDRLRLGKGAVTP